jgi:tRNA threonylcarbamoyladenosine biosynthesis protein TsaB
VLLAIETSTRAGSVALFSSPADAAPEHAVLEEGRSEQSLAPVVERMLRGRFDALTAYALSIGPGSFTGLRVGLAFIKGLALVVERPVVAISTLEVIAAGVARAEKPIQPILVTLDARAGELYAALFTSTGVADPALPDCLLPRDALLLRLRELGDRPLVVAGDGAPLLFGGSPPSDHNVVRPDLWVPDARVLGLLGWEGLKAGRGREVIDLEPAYLQRTAAERKFGSPQA